MCIDHSFFAASTREELEGVYKALVAPHTHTHMYTNTQVLDAGLCFVDTYLLFILYRLILI